MRCEVCKVSGNNMRRCTKCGKNWCQKCATFGKGPYPKLKAINVCPYCNKMNCVEILR